MAKDQKSYGLEDITGCGKAQRQKNTPVKLQPFPGPMLGINMPDNIIAPELSQQEENFDELEAVLEGRLCPSYEQDPDFRLWGFEEDLISASPEIIERYGLLEAIVIHKLGCWCRHNRMHPKEGYNCFYEGRVYVRNTRHSLYKEFHGIFSHKQLRTTLDRLVDLRILVTTTELNTIAGDFSYSYAFFNERAMGCDADMEGRQSGESKKVKQRAQTGKGPTQSDNPPSQTGKNSKDIGGILGDIESVCGPPDLPPSPPDPASSNVHTLFLYEVLKSLNPDQPACNPKTWDPVMQRMVRMHGEEKIKAAIQLIKLQGETGKTDFKWWKTITTPQDLERRLPKLFADLNSVRTVANQETSAQGEQAIIHKNSEWIMEIMGPGDHTDLAHPLAICKTYVQLKSKEKGIRLIPYNHPDFRRIVQEFIENKENLNGKTE